MLIGFNCWLLFRHIASHSRSLLIRRQQHCSIDLAKNETELEQRFRNWRHSLSCIFFNERLNSRSIWSMNSIACFTFNVQNTPTFKCKWTLQMHVPRFFGHGKMKSPLTTQSLICYNYYFFFGFFRNLWLSTTWAWTFWIFNGKQLYIILN